MSLLPWAISFIEQPKSSQDQWYCKLAEWIGHVHAQRNCSDSVCSTRHSSGQILQPGCCSEYSGFASALSLSEGFKGFVDCAGRFLQDYKTTKLIAGGDEELSQEDTLRQERVGVISPWQSWKPVTCPSEEGEEWILECPWAFPPLPGSSQRSPTITTTELYRD